MSKGRQRKTLDELLKEYYQAKQKRVREQYKKSREETDRYYGLRECFKNVHRNGSIKLSYCY